MEDAAYGSSPKSKNPDKQTMDYGEGYFSQGPQGDSIMHFVCDPGSRVQVMKTMGMNPETIGTLDLFINELKRRNPFPNKGRPSEGDAKEPKPVIDTGIFPHLNWCRRDDAETKLRRRNPLQIGCV
jgi:hypothetical protein